jgi:KDO2-lipid IV(A) lauroyltransferase
MNPKETPDNYITDLFNKKLEEDIKVQPEIWLWSHRRWKHKRTPTKN